jgi:hypothetical protein
MNELEIRKELRETFRECARALKGKHLNELNCTETKDMLVETFSNFNIFHKEDINLQDRKRIFRETFKIELKQCKKV